MSTLLVRQFGVQPYEPVWRAMQAFTESRVADTPDELWLLQHFPVFTLGMNGKPEHVLNQGDIPLIQIDRGGQVTYHGPGQIVAYLLLDLKRRQWGVRQMVTAMENTVIDVLRDYGINATARQDAPGVYVNDAKIAALGLRVKKGRSYHGLSFNVDMDLSPFRQINPCGYPDLEVTDCRSLGITAGFTELQQRLLGSIESAFGYNASQLIADENLPA